MTDLAVKPEAEQADADAAPTAPASDDGDSGATEAVWAPVEPEPKKRRVGMWVGIGVGVAAAGIAAASLVLIAPGTTVAGVPVGFMTAGAATDAVAARLAETTVVLEGDAAGAEVTGADLGASVDARALADTAFTERPMWNVTQWFGAPLDAPLQLDAETATAALRDAAPALYSDPVDATLAFDEESLSYVTTAAVEGSGIDLVAVQDALHDAFVAGETRVAFEAVPAPVVADTPTFVAESAAENLNRVLSDAGFYIGTERTVPLDRAVVASWLTVAPGERGTFDVTVDESAIEGVVAGLPEAVNRAPVDATVITDTSGDVLREVTAGVAGRELGDTSGIASDFAAQLAAGRPAFDLPVTEVPFETTGLARNIIVDLSEQRTYLFENGNVVASYASSTGLPGSPTFAGSFRINHKNAIQDMGCFEGAPYCTENVPWVAYFNGDQGFHGAYWHNNFGSQMSHGCVNLPVSTAKFVYDWAPIGTEVQVRY